jgi:predicted CXXCH cytochrome family protein
VADNTDWWVKYYPPENSKRPTSALCDGCHSTNFNLQTKTLTEWNVGCERCHGPGSDHAARPLRANIVNPARLDTVAASDTCIQCHSQGQPLQKPINGVYADWPVGFEMGKNLRDYWQLEEHKLGETTFTHFADGTAHKNRMQGNDFVQSVMYEHGVTCSSCHDVHGTEQRAQLIKPASVLCLECHGPASPNGPHASSIEAHTHHQAGTPGNDCVSCHMPKIATQLADVNVRSHTFRFVPPSMTKTDKVPNACNACHMDKSPEWASEALRSWKDRSPWRVE